MTPFHWLSIDKDCEQSLSIDDDDCEIMIDELINEKVLFD